MILYHEILRLTFLEHSQTAISKSTGHARGTIAKVQARAKEIGNLEDLLKKTDAELQELLFPEESQGPTKWIPDFEKLRKELLRPGVTKKLLWMEYKNEADQLNRPAYSYPQFCFYFQEDCAKRKASMHIARKPGESLEVDWSGDKFNISDPNTGKTVETHIFIAVLSYSQYTYAEAFHNEGMESWITAHVHAFEFFGGVTRELIPDNCKTAVIENTKNELILNVTYREMSEHYSTIILPARVRRPKDKPNAEGSVCCVQRLMLAPMRNDKFFSLDELNRAIRNKIDAFNATPFQKKEGSRRSVFEEDEKDLLIPLPATPFEIAQWKIATVQFNYHISVDKKMYSVPYTYIGKKVDVKITRTMIEVFYNNGRIASHQRSYDLKSKYITVEQHMPPAHQQMAKWDSKTLRDWAEKIGLSTYSAIDTLLRRAKVEQQAYKSCLAILNLSKRYSDAQLELACKEAIANGCINLKSIQKILKSFQNKTAVEENNSVVEDTNPHGLTRGPEYFGKENK